MENNRDFLPKKVQSHQHYNGTTKQKAEILQAPENCRDLNDNSKWEEKLEQYKRFLDQTQDSLDLQLEETMPVEV